MALIKSDRVKETSTSTGATTFALAGAGTGYRAFSSVCAIGDTFYYAISNQSNGEWEAGLGTYSALNTLTRTAVHSSSNSGNVVTFTSGTKEVFLTLTARHLDRINDNGQSTAIGSKTSVVAVNDSATLPDLDLQFSELKTLTAKYGPTPSYSRASTGRYTNASGVLTSAAVNEARFDHVYNGTNWISKGLLIEEQRTNLCTYSEDLNSWGYKVRMTVSSDAVVSPDGTQNADLIYPSSTGSYSQVGIITIPVSSGSAYTSSIFAKAAGKTWLYIYDPNGAKFAHFNLTTGSTGTVSAGSTSSIVNVGNGWYRCSITATTVNTGGLIYIGISDNDNNDDVTASGTNGIYAWGAQVEAGSFPTSYIPTVASSVTRSADVCQITGSAFTNLWNATEGSFALNYDCPANGTLVQYQANSAVSTNIHTAVSIGTTQYFQVYLPPEQALLNAGSIVANLPQGLSSAYKLNDFAASLNGGAVATDTAGSLPTPTKIIIGSDGSAYNNGHIARLRYFRSRLDNTQLVNLSGGINTLAFKPVTGSGSVTVANEYSGINISVPNPLPITNGGTGGTTAVSGAVNLIKSAPNDGAEYTLKSKQISGAPSFYWVDSTGYAPTLDLLFAADKSLTAYTGPTPSFSRASTGTFFNSSGVLTTAAVNAPRFDHVYDGTNWVSKGLLVEEQRTNLFTYSETFSNSAWVKTRVSITSGATTSPDGSSTASKIVEDTSSSSQQKFFYQTKTLTAATYTVSGYFKAAERGWVAFDITAGADIITYFDLSTGSVGSVGAGQTASIVNAGNGWYRCSVTFTGTAAAWLLIFMMSDGNNSTYYTGNGSSGVFAWGAQLELGSFPTSYIPTTTAAVTRSADVCQITGSDFSGFWNASEGSYTVEFDRLADHNAGNTSRWTLSFNNGSTSYIDNWAATPGGGSYLDISNVYSVGSQQASVFVTSSAGGVMAKSATGWKFNDFAASFNGGAVQTDNSVVVPVGINRLNIGMENSAYFLCGHIARLRYYPTRLPNATLQVLST